MIVSHGEVALHAGLPARASALYAGLVHAAGGPVAARVLAGAGGHLDARFVYPPRADHRDHPAAAAPVRRGRGRLVQRHRGPAARGRDRRGHQGRHRAGGRDTGAGTGGPGAAARAGAGRRALRDRGGPGARGRAGRAAADRLRGRSLHARVLPGRGRAVQEPRQDQGADVRQPGAVARAAGPAGRHHHLVPAGPGGGGGVGRAALRLVGGRGQPGRLPARRSCRTPAGSSPRSGPLGCRASTSGSGPGNCSG